MKNIEIYSVSEVMTILGVCERTLRNYMKQGKLKYSNPGTKRIYFTNENIMEFLNTKSK